LLPPGCKDLIDVLNLQKAESGIPQGQKSHLIFKKPSQKERPVIHLPSQVVVKELAAVLGAKLYKVISLLKEMKVFTSVNQKLPFYVASKVARRYGYAVQRKVG